MQVAPGLDGPAGLRIAHDFLTGFDYDILALDLAGLLALAKLRTRPSAPAGDVASRKPITGTAGCCARAASGQVAAATPSVAKNFRRSMWLAM